MSSLLYQQYTNIYDGAIQKCKECLERNDLAEASSYLSSAIEAAIYLANNAAIVELQKKYSEEYRRLLSLKDKLSHGENPFLKKKTVTTNGVESEEKETHYFSKEPPSVTLKDVAGLARVKEEIEMNVLLPMRNPTLYYAYNDVGGVNILMYGPPGCGKTFVAEAIAGELKCPFAKINVYDILDKYVGEAPRKIKEIFAEAEKYEQCMLFFDELDSLFSDRESDDSSHTKDVLTAFLTCISGFHKKSDKKSVRVVIGATNRPWIIDKAAIRGGRFDTHIYVGLPDEEARKFIVEKAFRNDPRLLQGSDLTIPYMSEKLEGFSGADITSICQKAKIQALKRAKVQNQVVPVLKSDFDEVMKTYKNTISKEDIQTFEAFEKGF